MSGDPIDRQILLVEYQTAQDSAQHHDNQVSGLTGLWIGSAVLIGFVLNGLRSHGLAHYSTVIYMVIALGLSMCALALVWSVRSGLVKNRKYARCKAIEEQLGMTQHTAETRRRWIWLLRWLVYCLPIGLLCAIWSILLVDVASATAVAHH